MRAKAEWLKLLDHLKTLVNSEGMVRGCGASRRWPVAGDLASPVCRKLSESDPSQPILLARARLRFPGRGDPVEPARGFAFPVPLEARIWVLPASIESPLCAEFFLSRGSSCLISTLCFPKRGRDGASRKWVKIVYLPFARFNGSFKSVCNLTLLRQLVAGCLPGGLLCGVRFTRRTDEIEGPRPTVRLGQALFEKTGFESLAISLQTLWGSRTAGPRGWTDLYQASGERPTGSRDTQARQCNGSR